MIATLLLSMFAEVVWVQHLRKFPELIHSVFLILTPQTRRKEAAILRAQDISPR